MSKISLSGLQRVLTQLVTWVKGLFATKNGRYSGLNVGAADMLNGANAIPVSDAFRSYVGESGSAFIRSIKGKSIVWNQEVNMGITNPFSASNGTVSIDENVITYTGNDNTTSKHSIITNQALMKMYCNAGDIILCVGYVKFTRYLPGAINEYNGCRFSAIALSYNYEYVGATELGVYTKSWHLGESRDDGYAAIRIGYTDEPFDLEAKNIMFFNLTKIFGAGNEPHTLSEFEAMFPLPYYDYNPGEIISNSASGLKIVGFNQWDEEWRNGYYDAQGLFVPQAVGAVYIANKNSVSVAPSTKYFIKHPQTMCIVVEKDASGNILSRTILGTSNLLDTFVTSASTRFVDFCLGSSTYHVGTYNHDVCFYFSDDFRNGEYEPHRESVLSLNLAAATGKVDGEGASVVVAADGLKSAGSAYDEAVVEDGLITKIIKRVGKYVFTGEEDWEDTGLQVEGCFTSCFNSRSVIGLSKVSGGLLHQAFVYTDSNSGAMSMFWGGSGTNYIYFRVPESIATDKSSLASWIVGSNLYYELAEPITYVLDEPIAAAYNIEKGGTESVVTEDSEFKDAVLFLRDIAYPQPSDLNMASLLPDFNHLAPVEVIEYDVARNGYCVLYNRANPIGTKASDVTDVVAFRLTVTGADMPEKQVISVMVMLPGRANSYPFGIASAITPDVSSASKYGIYQLRQYAPKVLGSGYGWGMEFNTYTANKRHIKVEVFKKTSAIEFYKIQTASSITSTNYIYVVTNADSFRPLVNLTANISGTATSAAYVNGYMPAFTGTSVFVSGEALTTNDLAFISTDGKAYKIGTKNKPIRPEVGIIAIGTNYNINTSIGYPYSRKITSGIAFTSISAERDTFAVLDEVFLRCTMANGELYSDGYLSNTMSAGYTWISVGIAYATTSMCVNTMGKEFLTLDANGRLTHINGKEIAVPSIENSLFKRGVVSQTINWVGNNTAGWTHTMSNLVYGNIELAHIELFNRAGAVFNETTGYFELNEILDISYQEMLDIYVNSIGGLPFNTNRNSQFNNYPYRTTIQTRFYSGYSTSINHMFVYSQYLETAFLEGCNNLSTTTDTFRYCRKLRKIIGELSASSWAAATFEQCASLEYVHIRRLRSNLELKQSSHLQLESVVCAVTYAENTAAVTITLHADAYARCVADTAEYTYNGQTYTGIIALATAKNITIASA